MDRSPDENINDSNRITSWGDGLELVRERRRESLLRWFDSVVSRSIIDRLEADFKDATKDHRVQQCDSKGDSKRAEVQDSPSGDP